MKKLRKIGFCGAELLCPIFGKKFKTGFKNLQKIAVVEQKWRWHDATFGKNL